MLEAKTAIVSGSSSGIGRAIAEELGSRGANVGINYYSNESGARAAADAVRDSGGETVVVQADLADPDDCERFVESVREDLGEIDVLVNNAGIIHRKSLEALGEDDWQRLLAVNLDSYFRLSKHIVPSMADRGEGVVVNVSSIWGRRGGANQSAYGASKGAIDALTKQLCHEFAPRGVRINAVSPGPIETQLNDEYIEDESEYERVKESVPAGRWGEPGEIASVVAFLAGPEASYVHGANVVVDGGRTI